ncbi:hypothetical protein OHC33_006371 [Knufia fluminis]|uniref:2-dehydropantoate 2-reductase n=1 Tax=Knufia fluminis TaxID=191047 RepID=A0AAN8EJE5_9EURO|nr:hypothetical protein OHC33_006371 [Knufia fluminis]
MSQQIDVLLYGLGAIGSFYAFILSRCKEVRLTVVARSNYEAVKSNGLKVISENHGEHVVQPFKVVKTPAEADQTFDYIVCAHKAIGQDAVPEQLKPVVGDKTTIVLIQNGVGNEEPFRAAFPQCTILSCVTWVGARQNTPGVINHTKSEDMQIGLFPNNDLDKATEKARLDKFAGLLTEGKTVFQVVDNVQVQRWEKVVWNAAWNSITTLTMLDTQTWLKSSPDAMPLTRKVMAEVIDVAKKCGVPLEYELIDRLINKILAMPGIGSSMQTDAKNGRPLELDVILGTPVRKGRELGVSIPTVETIYVLLLGVNRRLENALSSSS